MYIAYREHVSALPSLRRMCITFSYIYIHIHIHFFSFFSFLLMCTLHTRSTYPRSLPCAECASPIDIYIYIYVYFIFPFFSFQFSYAHCMQWALIRANFPSLRRMCMACFYIYIHVFILLFSSFTYLYVHCIQEARIRAPFLAQNVHHLFVYIYVYIYIYI